MKLIDGFKSFLGKKRLASKIPKNDHIEDPEKYAILPGENGIPKISPEIQDYFDEISDDGWIVEKFVGIIGDKRDDRYSDKRGKECRISIKPGLGQDLESNLDSLGFHLRQAIKRLESTGYQLSVGKHGNGIIYGYILWIKSMHPLVDFSSSNEVEVNITNNIQFDKIKKDFLLERIIESFEVKIYLL